MINKIKKFMKKYWILILTFIYIFAGILLQNSIIVIIGCTIVIIEALRHLKNQILTYIEDFNNGINDILDEKIYINPIDDKFEELKK